MWFTSWGVLYHTGSMWPAIEQITRLVLSGGALFIAIYDDQGVASRRWKRLKALYNTYCGLRVPLEIYPAVRLWTFTLLRDSLKRQPPRSWRDYKSSRGMSTWHDVVDWIGGDPFHVATPEKLLDFCKARGFQLERLPSCAGGPRCNQFVFIRTS